MPTFDFNLTKKGKVRKSTGGEYTGNVGRPKGCTLINKVDRSNSNQARFGHRKSTTSKNKFKDTPIKHGYHLEDYNRICVYEHYYDKELNPFYVGSGTLQRAFVFSGVRRSPDYNNKALDINLIKVKIIFIDISKEEAFDKEYELIRKYGIISEGGSLINTILKGNGNPKLIGKGNSVKVLQYSKSMKFIKEWESANHAANSLKIDCSCIIKVCKRKPKYNSAGGYIWRYKCEKIGN